MAGDIRDDLSPATGEPIDPVALARRDLQKALPRRFYRTVATGEADGGVAVLLDGKPVRTPAKAAFVLPNAALAEAVAAEWQAQTEIIDPGAMPLTKLVNSAIDGVAHAVGETVREVARFAETDLTCYRAESPAALVEAQGEAWDPVLVFARDALGARFACVQGLMYVAQPAPALEAVASAVRAVADGGNGALRLAALSVETNLMGSVLLALAVAHGRMTPQEAWAAAHVDEDYQARQWGGDVEATARRAVRWTDMAAAARLYDLAGPQR